MSGPSGIATTTITVLNSMHLANILRTLPYVVGSAEVRLDNAMPPGEADEGVNLPPGAMGEISERVELTLGGQALLATSRAAQSRHTHHSTPLFDESDLSKPTHPPHHSPLR